MKGAVKEGSKGEGMECMTVVKMTDMEGVLVEVTKGVRMDGLEGINGSRMEGMKGTEIEI